MFFCKFADAGVRVQACECMCVCCSCWKVTTSVLVDKANRQGASSINVQTLVSKHTYAKKHVCQTDEENGGRGTDVYALYIAFATIKVLLSLLGWAVAGPIGNFQISIPIDRSFLVGSLQRGRGGDKNKIG